MNTSFHRFLNAAGAACALLLLPSVLSAQWTALSGSPHGRAGDFNGDGRDDLAIGVEGETLAGQAGAGAVNILYGASSGISADHDHFDNEDSSGFAGSCEEGDAFGSVLAAGDFNGDGYSDLAIGAPREDFNPQIDGGVVYVLYGRSNYLFQSSVDYWHEDAPGIADSAEQYDLFGSALAAGDFNNDGYDDLAISNSREAGAYNVRGSGAVHVLLGSSSGLTATGSQFLCQGPGGLLGSSASSFGSALAAGDFNYDGYDDLAIGAPGDIGYFGSVTVLYGYGSGLKTSGYHYWHQTGIGLGTSGASDGFGTALAAGDFGGDGASDLAIGIPYDDNTTNRSGSVIVLYGVAGQGTRTSGAQFFSQDSQFIPDSCDGDDNFGRSLAAGDLDNSGRDDLAIGAPYEDLEHLGVTNAGAVHVLYSNGNALWTYGNDYWTQEGPELLDIPTTGDDFGTSLMIGDFNGDGYGDLVIGVPGEHKFNPFDYGVVHVIYGGSNGLNATGSQHWDQDDPGVLDSREDNDFFGGALG